MLTERGWIVDLADAGAVHVQLDALGDPELEQLVVRLARLGDDAADVGNGTGGLEQHQALFRSDAVEAPAFQVVGQAAVIAQRIVAAQRQLEAVLALGRPVAGAGIAAHARQGRHHVPDKADLRLLLQSLHLDVHDGNLVLPGDAEGALAVGDGPDLAGGSDPGHLRGRLDLRQPRQVDALTGWQHAGHQQLAVLERRGESDRGRLHFQANHPDVRRQFLLGSGGNRSGQDDQQQGERKTVAAKEGCGRHGSCLVEGTFPYA